MPARNLFRTSSPPAHGEQFEALLRCRNVTVERILSSPEVTPHTYLQKQDEWVALLRGSARLEVGDREVCLESGDTLFIPAQTPHRVTSVSKAPTCIWLAVHIYSEESETASHSSETP